MFSKHHLFKLFVAIAVAASIAVAGARTAKASNPYNPQAYVYGGASQQVAQAIQSAGNGKNRSVEAARHQKRLARVTGLRIITDTLGGNGGVGQPNFTVSAWRHIEQEQAREVSSGFRMITDTLGGNGQLPSGLGGGRSSVA